MTAMVRYGVDTIMAQQKGSMTSIAEDNIDEIIARGAKASKKLNEAIRTHAKKAFTISSTDYCLIDDIKHLGKDVIKEAQAFRKGGSDFIQLNPKGKVSGEKLESGRGLPDYKALTCFGVPRKLPTMHAFQFYNTKRIRELHRKEVAYCQTGLKPLTEGEEKERSQLLSEGWSNWNYRHFWAYVNASKKYGKTNVSKIAQVMKKTYGQSEEEVAAYHKIFWENAEAQGLDKILSKIEHGAKMKIKNEKYQEILRKKVESYGDPMRQMTFPFASYSSKAHGFTLAHDRFMVMQILELGYGNWKGLKIAFLNSARFRFDYFIKTRTLAHFLHRMKHVIASLENEFREYKSIGKKRKRQSDPLATNEPKRVCL